MQTQLQLFLTGLLISATAELPFDLYCKLWPSALATTWERLTWRDTDWSHQAYYWGDPNRDSECI
jgi:hypothetical protein